MSPASRGVLLRAARAAAPREACGLLFGDVCGEALEVQHVFVARNAHDGAGGFAIGDAELARGHRLAHRLGLAVVSVFHSHPSGSGELSELDREAFACAALPWTIVTYSPLGLALHFYDTAARTAATTRST